MCTFDAYAMLPGLFFNIFKVFKKSKKNKKSRNATMNLDIHLKNRSWHLLNLSFSTPKSHTIRKTFLHSLWLCCWWKGKPLSTPRNRKRVIANSTVLFCMYYPLRPTNENGTYSHDRRRRYHRHTKYILPTSNATGYVDSTIWGSE